MSKTIYGMTKEELAKWLHDNYEAIAKEKDWNTQQSCKVEFNTLPDANKRTMIEIADRLLNFNLLRLHFVGVSLPVESFDVDDWLGLTHGVWYHPFIELHDYDNGDKKSIELSQIIADYANSIIQQ